ncbi:MAG: antibiotic biosynthesis monooxygenase family protein [Promethearchaeota archaeon]|jgi:quinol monooxygenase YgiN
MWVRLTFVKIQPDKVDELRKIYYDEIVPTVKAQNGNVDIFIMEPIDSDENFISLTSWDSKDNGDTYESSGTYQEMVNKVKFAFATTPTLKSYEVKN